MTRAWPRTIRHRLLLGLALPLSLVLALALFLHYREALALTDEAFDQALLNTAVALAARIEIDTDQDLDVDLPSSAQAVLQADVVDRMHLAVFDEAGALVWGEAALADCASAVPASRSRASSVRCGGQVLRMLVLEHQGPNARARVIVAETTLKREQAARQILRSAGALGLALWAVALATVYAVTRRVMLPLERAAAALDAGSAAELRPFPTSGQPAELGLLLTAMNGLMERLKAQALAQRNMLADVAHQLRTPLAGLGLQLALLEQDGPQQELRQGRRQAMAASLRRMQGLIDKLLGLARASADAQARDAVQDCELGALVEAVADGFVDLAAERGAQLVFELKAAPLRAVPGELQELLGNLIENALQHGCSGPVRQITVRCGAAGREVYLEVEDQGPGIAPALRGQLFERFSRGEASNGSGLGLAIVRAIAERHGARIELGSGAQGLGVRLRVSFPGAESVG